MSQEITIFKNEKTGKHVARVGDHLILFKSAKCNCYTPYIEDSINLDNDFHKSYFDENEYDYWENSEYDIGVDTSQLEDRTSIWNCRTNEWEEDNAETSDH